MHLLFVSHFFVPHDALYQEHPPSFHRIKNRRISVFHPPLHPLITLGVSPTSTYLALQSSQSIIRAAFQAGPYPIYWTRSIKPAVSTITRAFYYLLLSF